MRKVKSSYTFDWQGYSGYGFDGYEKSMDTACISQSPDGNDTSRLRKNESGSRKKHERSRKQ